MRIVSWKGVAAGALFVIGCSSGDASDPIGTASSPIIKGTASTSDQDAVVLLAMRRGTQLAGTCTGTLVAPNLVLTARHCVAETDRGALCSHTGRPVAGGAVGADFAASDIYVYTGIDGVRRAHDRNAANARGKLLVHENARTLCNADIAFMVLDRSIQGRIAPIRVKGAAREGELLTSVGWGLTEAGEMPDKRMQRARVQVLGVGPLALDEANNIGVGASEFVVAESICSGDSGGPAFSSKGAVVGVVSRGGGGGENPNNEAQNCIGRSVLNTYTHLSDKGALVTKAFAAAGAEPRTEGAPPGKGVGESCKSNLECSSDACIEGVCERRCDDGTTCAPGEVCTAVGDKQICAPEPTVEPASEDLEAEPAAAAPSRTVITETTGCSSAPGRAPAGAAFALALGAVALASMRRRRSRA
ncbi:MAG: trypsin-like serine protease [Labilithrix sp.]|nr:trypsin-like serine protease [Labilithrix sp.]